MEAVQDSLRTCSPLPAHRFAERVLVADQSVSCESPDAAALGLSVAFLTLTRWITAAIATAGVTKPERRAVDWAHEVLGPTCGRAAARAATLVGFRDAPSRLALLDDLGEELLPALIWLAAGLVAEYGHGDPSWLRHDA